MPRSSQHQHQSPHINKVEVTLSRSTKLKKKGGRRLFAALPHRMRCRTEIMTCSGKLMHQDWWEICRYFADNWGGTVASVSLISWKTVAGYWWQSGCCTWAPKNCIRTGGQYYCTTTCGSNWSLFVDTLVNFPRLGQTLFLFYSLLLVTIIFDACSYQ